MIYVFKTSVESKNQVEVLAPQLITILHSEKWNFDLEDCDKILRVESQENVVPKITELLIQNNFQCWELD
jgi:hypothetical protein